MASAATQFFYECHLAVKDGLTEILNQEDQESDLCRGISMLLRAVYHLHAVRRLSSRRGSTLVSSIIFSSGNEMPPSLREEAQTMIKVYTRGWVEGLGCAHDSDYLSLWEDCLRVTFFCVN